MVPRAALNVRFCSVTVGTPIRETEKRSQGAYERLVRLHRHWYERLNKNLDGEGRGYSWLPSLAAFTALMVFRLGGGAN